MTPPPVVVVIPLFNQGKVVERAVRSVLAQSCKEWTMIVVDDGSTDSGALRVEAFGDPRISVITTSNQGPGSARNAGIRASEATWVALLDADDEWEPTFLARALGVAGANPSLGCIYTLIRVGASLHRTVPQSEGLVKDYFAVRLESFIALTSSSVVLHRDRFLALGAFPEARRYCEDQDAWFRLVCCEQLYLIPEPLVRRYTDTPGSLTKSVGLGERIEGLGALLTTYQDWLDRGRVPTTIQFSCDQFMHNQRACLARHQLKAGKRRQGLRTLAGTRLDSFTWKVYLSCLLLAVKPSRWG